MLDRLRQMEPFELRFCCRARPKRSDETAISREDAGRGKYCAPAGAKTCMWRGRRCHPNDLRVCTAAGSRYGAGSALTVETMANKTKVTPQKDKVPEKEGQETPSDSPLLDLSDAAVKKLIRSAKKRGYVTHDQINSVLRSEEVNSEQIEDVLAMLSEMGIVAIPILSGLHHHYIRI